MNKHIYSKILFWAISLSLLTVAGMNPLFAEGGQVVETRTDEATKKSSGPMPADKIDSEGAALDLSDTPWAGLKVPYGASLTVRETSKGKIKTLKIPGGVTLTQMPDGKIRENDNSGKGAVLCLQRIFLEIKDTLERCSMNNHFMPNPQEAHFWLTLSLEGGDSPTKQEALGLLASVRDQITKEQERENASRLSKWEPMPMGIGEEPILNDEIYRGARQRAERGDLDAQYALSIIYRTGMRGNDEPLAEPDYLEAEKWLLLSAKGGHLTAQFDLASGYEDGEFGAVNLQKAEQWYLKAAQQGSVEAQFALGRLYAKRRNEKMTPEELKEELDSALNRIADFVAVNSLTPITKEEIEEKTHSYKMHMDCAARQGSMYMLEDFRKKTPQEFRGMTEELLSVPRPPVMSPCL